MKIGDRVIVKRYEGTDVPDGTEGVITEVHTLPNGKPVQYPFEVRLNGAYAHPYLFAEKEIEYAPASEPVEELAKQVDSKLTPSTENNFLDGWLGVEYAAHENGIAHGFWGTPDALVQLGVPFLPYAPSYHNKAEKLALIHAEISEALEEIRNDEIELSEKIPTFTKVEEELADAVIRIMDFAAAYGYDVAHAVIAKHDYNTTRPFKHGKKF